MKARRLNKSQNERGIERILRRTWAISFCCSMQRHTFVQFDLQLSCSLFYCLTCLTWLLYERCSKSHWQADCSPQTKVDINIKHSIRMCPQCVSIIDSSATQCYVCLFQACRRGTKLVSVIVNHNAMPKLVKGGKCVIETQLPSAPFYLRSTRLSEWNFLLVDFYRSPNFQLNIHSIIVAFPERLSSVTEIT